MNEHAAPADPKADRKEYWRDVAERTIRSFAQGMLAALGIGGATFDKGGWPWLDAFYIGVGCAVLALLMSLAGGKIGDPTNGSFRGRPAAPPKPDPDAPEKA